MRINKGDALLEFGFNLTEQKILTKKQFYDCITNFEWKTIFLMFFFGNMVRYLNIKCLIKRLKIM